MSQFTALATWLVGYNVVFPLLAPSFFAQVCDLGLHSELTVIDHAAVITGFAVRDAWGVAVRWGEAETFQV